MAFQLNHTYVEDNGVYKHNELQFFRVDNKRNVRAVAPTRQGLYTCFSANQLVAKSGGPMNLIPTCKSCDDFANERNLKKKLRGKTQFSPGIPNRLQCSWPLQDTIECFSITVQPKL